MPATKLSGIENTSLQWALWRITESLPQCLDLAKEYHIPIAHLSHPERIRQYVTSRVLLLQSFPHIEPVFVTHKAPPEVKNSGVHVSFSHTREYSCLVLSEGKKAGIDMEFDREKIFRIHTRFCAPAELSYLEAHPELASEISCILWCIKEALYKKYPEKKLNFAREMFVPFFTPSPKGCITEVHLLQGPVPLREKCYIENINNHWMAIV